jgi:hypothetical protein
MAKLDHIMYGVPDLTKAIPGFAGLTGIEPAIGGAHPGRGTRNALMSLGDDQYLEIIAPDPDQDLTGNMGGELLEKANSGIRGWAVATDNLEAVSKTVTAQGWSPQPIIDMSRTTPDGVRLDWQLMFVTGHKLLPFFIDWKDSPHPALSTPGGCSLLEFSISTPDPGQYQATMDALQIQIEVVSGKQEISAQLKTPAGHLTLGYYFADH